MGYAVRSYRGHDQDAEIVLAFLTRINQHAAYVTDYHIGDFVWRTWRIPAASVGDSLAIWTDDAGQTVAIGWFDAPREFAMTLDPALFGTAAEAELVRQVAAWADVQYQRERGSDDRLLGLTVRRDDSASQAILAELGYAFSGETWYAGNFRTLAGPVPAPALPAGYRIETMEAGADLDDRVEIHREVWAPSKFTREAYDLIRDAPVYRADLDLVVRAPDGRYASYLIAWWDANARSGLLEPVGARPEFRRLGLTGALIQDALRRFSELGVTQVYVNSRAVDEPANALYRSAGFERIAEWQWWHRA